MQRLSLENPRYGYRRITALVRREDWPVTTSGLPASATRTTCWRCGRPPSGPQRPMADIRTFAGPPAARPLLTGSPKCGCGPYRQEQLARGLRVYDGFLRSGVRRRQGQRFRGTRADRLCPKLPTLSGPEADILTCMTFRPLIGPSPTAPTRSSSNGEIKWQADVAGIFLTERRSSDLSAPNARTERSMVRSALPLHKATN